MLSILLYGLAATLVALGCFVIRITFEAVPGDYRPMRQRVIFSDLWYAVALFAFAAVCVGAA